MAAFLGLFVVGIILGAFIMWAVSNLLSDAFQDRAAESEIRDANRQMTRLEQENKRLEKRNQHLDDLIITARDVHRDELRSVKYQRSDEYRLLEETVEVLKDRKVELENALARTKLEIMKAKEGK